MSNREHKRSYENGMRIMREVISELHEIRKNDDTWIRVLNAHSLSNRNLVYAIKRSMSQM